MRDFFGLGRSAVHATETMVATSHPLAAATALRVLAGGGNAADAAVAAAAMLGVVEPEQTGPGGDLFALIRDPASGSVTAIDGAGHAPAAVTAEGYRKAGLTAMPFDGPHAVTVPGAVDAWCAINARFGSRPLGELLAPSIRAAADGHPVHERVAWDWANAAAGFARDANAAAVYLPGGAAPRAGALFRQPALARTLERVAEQGRAGFYEGPVAAEIVAYLSARGGLHSLADFAEQQTRMLAPLALPFRDLTVLQSPPSAQGLTTLVILGLIERLDRPASDPLDPARVTLLARIAAAAYAQRDAVIADRAAMAEGPEALLASAALDRLAGALDRPAPPAPTPPPAGDTAYLAVVDGAGMAVSLISSVYKSHGSGLMPPGCGVLLQNRGAGFVLAEGHANAIGPRKRPLHTIIPGMALRQGGLAALLGVVGGDFQPFGQALVLTAMRDFGLDPQRALDLPRFFPFRGEARMEPRLPAPARAALVGLGLAPVTPVHPLGIGQAILRDAATGTLTAGSDPRGDGLALGW